MYIYNCQAGTPRSKKMTNTIKTTYKQTSTDELISSLKIKNELFFKHPRAANLIISEIDKIQCELVSRGFTWEQVEALKF